METNRQHVGWFQPLISLFLGWLAIAGIADDFVTWKQWFEVGVMEKWRYLKDIVGFRLTAFLDAHGKLMPGLPDYYFERIVFTLAFLRAVHQVDAANRLRGTFIISMMILYIFLGMLSSLISIIQVYLQDLDTPSTVIYWLIVVPLINAPRGLYIYTCIFVAIIAACQFYASFVNPNIVKELADKPENEDDVIDRAFMLHGKDILFWLVITFGLAICTVFVASDVLEKI